MSVSSAASSENVLKRAIDWRGAFWVASGVPALVLFSIGITKGKWGTLLNALLEFKKDYDNNAPQDEQAAVQAGLDLRDNGGQRPDDN